MDPFPLKAELAAGSLFLLFFEPLAWSQILAGPSLSSLFLPLGGEISEAGLSSNKEARRFGFFSVCRRSTSPLSFPPPLWELAKERLSFARRGPKKLFFPQVVQPYRSAVPFPSSPYVKE